VELKPFQDEDISKLEDVAAAAFFWNMGSGKTLAAVERDRRLRAQHSPTGPTLVVAPLAVHDHWERHFLALGWEEQNVLPINSFASRDMFLSCIEMECHDNDVFIINWDLLRMPKVNSTRRYFSTDLYHAIIGEKGWPMKRRKPWFHVIADEAHRAKNKDVQQTKVLKQINTRFKTALTGTPIANTPPDLWSLLNWLDPKEFSSYWRWYERYSNYGIDWRADPRNPEKLVQYKVYMGPKNVESLKRRIEPFTAVRGREVRPQLPPRNVELHVDLDPKQRRAYDTMKKHFVAWLGEAEDSPLTASNAISKLQRLQQLAIAHADVDLTKIVKKGATPKEFEEVWKVHLTMQDPSSKLDALMQLLEDNPDEQFVVFSQFRGAIDLLSIRLEHAGISYGKILGGQSADERRAAISTFADGRSRVIAGTISAGGEGIDGLQRASALVFVDRDWTTTRNDQAIGRLDRFGQSNQVVVYDIIARNTVDQYKRQQLRTKAEWIRTMMS